MARLEALALALALAALCALVRGSAIEPLAHCFNDANTAVDRAKIFFGAPDGSASLYAVNADCFECALSLMVNGTGTDEQSFNCASVWVPFPWTLYLIDEHGVRLASKKHRFGEQGEYVVGVQSNGDGSVAITVNETKKPINSMLAFWIVFGVLAAVIVVSFSYQPVLKWWFGDSADPSTAPNYSTVPLMSDGTERILMAEIVDDKDGDLAVRAKTAAAASASAGAARARGGKDSDAASRKAPRVQSLDTFRGLSLLLMIFVNYGGGGYYFFDHAAWNGLTVADLVFPWFMWIMGVSMALSFANLLPKPASSVEAARSGGDIERQGSSNASNTNTETIDSKVWWRVCKRSLILFLLGMFLANGYEYITWRVPGVLQYFAVSYFVTSATVLSMLPYTQRRLQQIANNLAPSTERMKIADSVVTATSSASSVWGGNGSILSQCKAALCGVESRAVRILNGYAYEWIIQAALLIIYLSVNYGAAAPGCPVGYLGPGGIGDHGDHRACTGGIHRYIDMKTFSYNLIYHHPTCMELYDCIPYDPEGLLGTLSACTLTYLGLMTGRVLLHFKAHVTRLTYWGVASLVLMLLAGILCGFSQNEGVSPINKNLWSTSFVCITAGFALVGLSVCYVLVDVYKVWTGAPLLFLGMNSILIYCAHGVFQKYFPFAFQVYVFDHVHLMATNVVGVFCWVVIAYYFYKIKFFVKI